MLIGEPKTPHFYDFGILGRVPEPQSQLCLSLETPGHLKEIKKSLEHFKTYYVFFNLKVLEIHIVVDLGKDWRRQIPPIRLMNS